MNQLRFDQLARRWGGRVSRRGLMATGIGAIGGGALGAAPANAACLGKRRQCKRDGQCCSGRCAGKKGKKRCAAVPNQSICTREFALCLPDVPRRECGLGATFCDCTRTLHGESFCATFKDFNPVCGCASDGECRAAIGAGARCIQRAGIGCDVCAPAPTMCALPCLAPA